MAKLKVFCATSGFHDSLVAAPSKPAALKAWGAKTDLFSMGVAHLVTDPKIAKKALDRPGEVIRIKRIGGGEAVAAPTKRRRPAKPPSRTMLRAAEEKLTELGTQQEKAIEAIDFELKVLERKREQLATRHAKARKAAEERVDQARHDYEAALADWEG